MRILIAALEPDAGIPTNRTVLELDLIISPYQTLPLLLRSLRHKMPTRLQHFFVHLTLIASCDDYGMKVERVL